MSTQPSILQAQTLRAAFVDSNRILTPSAYWFLISLFQGAQNGIVTANNLGTLTQTVSTLPTLLQGTHAQRLAATATSYTPGTVWFETDRTVFYYVSAAHVWTYAVGVYNAPLASIPADLGAADANFLFGATDYKHQWIWSGSAWSFAPGHGSKVFQASDGTPPLGGLWAPCDGTNVMLSRNDGTVASFVTPNLTGNVFILGGAYSAPLAATRPTWDPAAVTETASSANTAAESADTIVQSGTGVSVAAAPHTHANVHNHALTNANALLKPPSEANGGLPLRINLAWYVRR